MRRRILLADDSVTIQKVIELTFLDEDYEVKAVSNGDEAIAALSQVNPDFVIADVHMPGANGYEVCRRSKELRPGMPVLLLVGTFEPFDEGQARAVGADSFLKKPFDSQELLQRVEDLIAARSPAAPPAPATDWGSFQLEPSTVPPPADPFPAPAPFPLEEDRPFPAYGESSFDESPFKLDDEPPLGSALSPIDESALLPADEPLFDLDATPDAGFEAEPPASFEALSFETPSLEPPPYEPPAFETPSFEPPPLSMEAERSETVQLSGFATFPEERLGVPEGAVPLVESRAETEARIEAPPPPSIEASHEPESTAPATASVPAPVVAAPV